MLLTLYVSSNSLGNACAQRPLQYFINNSSSFSLRSGLRVAGEEGGLEDDGEDDGED